MISATKLRRYQGRLSESTLYKSALTEMLSIFSGSTVADENALFRKAVSPVLPDASSVLILTTADRGLCGSFNGSIVRRASEIISDMNGAALNPVVLPIGKKGVDAVREKGWTLCPDKTIVTKSLFDFAEAKRLSSALLSAFFEDKYRSVDIVYTEFRSAISQVIVTERLLPIPLPTKEKSTKDDIIIEPDEELILAELAKRVVSFRLYYAVLHSSTAEHGARMTAMDSATRNSEDLINETTIKRNKLRQAMITRELVEIVSGAESLKG